MKPNSRKALDILMSPEDIPRITRQEFHENLDEIIGGVSNADMVFVVTEDGKDDALILPARWFDIVWDEPFGGNRQ